MSLVRMLRGDREETRSSSLPTVTNLEQLAAIIGGSKASIANASTIDNALAHPTVWRSVNKIAGMFVQMPTHGYVGDRRLDVTPSVAADPSPGFMRQLAWKRAAATSMNLRGGAYGFTGMIRADGSTDRCDLIHPDRVTWTPSAGWQVDGSQVKEWPLGNFWQVPLMTLPGSPKGLNPLEYARRTTYAGMAAAEFGGNFFRDGAHPTVVIQPDKDPGPEGAASLKAKVAKAVSGTSREPLVLPQSVEWHQIQINPDDSQFIELMQFSGGQLAGFFGLDPSHVGLPGEGGSMDYSNRENRQQDILQDAVMQVVLPLDEGLSALAPDGVSVRSSPEGLLRSDQAARFAVYAINAEIESKTGQPILLNEEIRALENRLPLPAAPAAPMESDT